MAALIRIRAMAMRAKTINGITPRMAQDVGAILSAKELGYTSGYTPISYRDFTDGKERKQDDFDTISHDLSWISQTTADSRPMYYFNNYLFTNFYDRKLLTYITTAGGIAIATSHAPNIDQMKKYTKFWKNHPKLHQIFVDLC